MRELRNVVRQAVLQTHGLAVTARAARVGEPARGAARAPVGAGRIAERDRASAAGAAERDAIRESLRAGGNKSHAARALKTDYKTLHLKMKSLGIRARDYSP